MFLDSTPSMTSFNSSYEVRLACREDRLDYFPSLALAGYLCVNLVMMDREYADQFQEFCAANPVPCPLLGVIPAGKFEAPEMGRDIDLRTDLRSYDVLIDGVNTGSRNDVVDLFNDRTVSFLIGSSVSLDGLLVEKGYRPSFGPCIYLTSVACKPVERYSGNMAVTMRSYEPAIADTVAEYTSHFPKCHGQPIGRNNPAALGIIDEHKQHLPFPGWVPAGHDKLYWGCGITPSIVAQNAKLPLMIVHTPGNALITDIRTEELYT